MVRLKSWQRGKNNDIHARYDNYHSIVADLEEPKR